MKLIISTFAIGIIWVNGAVAAERAANSVKVTVCQVDVGYSGAKGRGHTVFSLVADSPAGMSEKIHKRLDELAPADKSGADYMYQTFCSDVKLYQVEGI
jgi:hypothetical protein